MSGVDAPSDCVSPRAQAFLRVRCGPPRPIWVGIRGKVSSCRPTRRERLKRRRTRTCQFRRRSARCGCERVRTRIRVGPRRAEGRYRPEASERSRISMMLSVGGEVPPLMCCAARCCLERSGKRCSPATLSSDSHVTGTIDMTMSSSTRPQPWARALYMCHQWVCCTYSRWRSRFRRTDTTRRELIRALGPASAQGGRTGRTNCCAARLVADGSTPAGRRTSQSATWNSTQYQSTTPEITSPDILNMIPNSLRARRGWLCVRSTSFGPYTSQRRARLTR